MEDRFDNGLLLFVVNY